MEIKLEYIFYVVIIILIIFLIMYGIWYYFFRKILILDVSADLSPPVKLYTGSFEDILNKKIYLSRYIPNYLQKDIYLAMTTATQEKAGKIHYIVMNNRRLTVNDSVNAPAQWKISKRTYKSQQVFGDNDIISYVIESVNSPGYFMSIFESSSGFITVLSKEIGNQNDQNYFINNGDILFDNPEHSDGSPNFFITTVPHYLSTSSATYNKISVSTFGRLPINDELKNKNFYQIMLV